MTPEQRLEELRFNVARSLRYHDKRRFFFDIFGKLLQLVSLAGSSLAIIALIKVRGSDSAAVTFSAFAALSTLLNLVVGTTSKLEAYTKLKNKFLDLQVKIEALQTQGFTEASVAKLVEERAAVEKEEPSISNWLNKVCYNETIDALGYDPQAKRPVHWWYHLGNLKLS